MEPPLMGEHGIVVTDLRPLDIHGSRYLDLFYVLDGDPTGTRRVARIGPEALEGAPHVGQRLVAQFAMRQMIRARLEASSERTP